MFDFLNFYYWRLKFKAADRQDFYQMMALQLAIGVSPSEACQQVFNAYSQRKTDTDDLSAITDPIERQRRKAAAAVDAGKRPKHIIALVAQDCSAGGGQGIKFHEKMARWVPYAEAATIQAGAEAGAGSSSIGASLAGGLMRASKLLENKNRVGDALVTKLMYPILLLCGAFSLAYFFALYVIPRLTHLTQSAGQLHTPTFSEQVATLIAVGGEPFAIAVVILIVLLCISFPLLTGPIRVRLDRHFPYSLYRIATGATFFSNIGVYAQSGIQYGAALSKMEHGASRYLKERLSGIRSAMGNGRDLGTSLDLAGFEFPGRDAIAFAKVVGSIRGSGEQISLLGEKWMERALKQLEKGAGVFRQLSYLVFGLVLWLILAAVNENTDALMRVFGS